MKPLANTAQERRTSLVLLQYWNALRGDRDFPHENQLDPDELASIWERCFLVQVRDIEQVKDFNYTYFGMDLTEAYQSGVLDRDNGKMVAPDANHLSHIYMEVLQTRDPFMDEGEYINAAGKTILFRQAFMPLGNADGVIESILGGAWFRLDQR